MEGITQFTLNKLYEFEGNITVQIYFLGKKQQKNCKKEVKLLDQMLEKMNDKLDLKEMIYIIRTVFRKLQEENITIEIKINDDLIKRICYNRRKIISYYNLNYYNDEFELEFRYDKGNIHYFVPNCGNRAYNKIIDEEIALILRNNLDELNNLNFVFPKLVMSYDESFLTSLYTLFFDRGMDFNDKEDGIRLQTIINILIEKYVRGSDYNYQLEDDMDYPFSLKLQNIIENMKIMGEINKYEINTTFIKNSYVIHKLGEIVREYIRSNNLDELEFLKKLSTSIYTGEEYVKLPSYDEINRSYFKNKKYLRLKK